jgi:hypothetical protein
LCTFFAYTAVASSSFSFISKQTLKNRGAMVENRAQTFLGNLSLLALLSQFLLGSQMARAQDNLLSRGDENRSQFAGSNMKRVQSYGQPASQDKAALPADDEPVGSQPGSEGALRQKGNKASPFGTQSGSDKMSAPGAKVNVAPELAQMQPRTFKNVPVQAVYLNGVNVVGLHNQSMKGVNIRFDENGNVFIDAPQYEVQYDTSYHPLLPDELPGFEKQQAPLPSGILSGEAISPSQGAAAGSRSTSKK